MTEAPTTAGLTIEDVKQEFDQWRASRSNKVAPIPHRLWQAAAELCKTHRITHVCRHLRLSFSELKKHLPAKEEIAFMELGVGGLIGQWQLTCQRPDGARLVISAPGYPPALDALIGQFLS